MPINATDDEVRSAGPAHVGSTAAQHKSVDVSSVAVVAAFAGHVTMDAEAFGVTVSRRPGACDTNLTGYERGRLLDVLCVRAPIVAQIHPASRVHSQRCHSRGLSKPRGMNICSHGHERSCCYLGYLHHGLATTHNLCPPDMQLVHLAVVTPDLRICQRVQNGLGVVV